MKIDIAGLACAEKEGIKEKSRQQILMYLDLMEYYYPTK